MTDEIPYSEEDVETDYKPSDCPWCKCKMRVKHITYQGGRPAGYNVIGEHHTNCYMENNHPVVFASIEFLKDAWEIRS